jgi:hypothetical protein
VPLNKEIVYSTTGTRALVIDTERQRISGEDDVEDRKRYQAISEVRNRIHDELAKDVEALAEHHPELLKELQEVVCK